MKTVYQITAAATLAALMSACAGGGGVGLITTGPALPTLKATDASQLSTPGTAFTNINVQVDNAALGTVEAHKAPYDNGYWVMDVDTFFYKAADGRLYNLKTVLGQPFAPTSSGVSIQEVPSKVYAQQTESGGKLVVCCDYSATFKPGYTGDYLRYGMWLDQSGQVNRFVTGVLATPNRMLGARNNNGVPTGKASYSVMAFRSRNGEVYASSHHLNRVSGQSIITVNFNTNQIGGTILGNAEFGNSIEFKNVTVNGNAFSGTVSSGSQNGTVSGNFYNPGGYYSGGNRIGGLIDFTGDTSLNAVFGGSTHRESASDTSQDLTPLP